MKQTVCSIALSMTFLVLLCSCSKTNDVPLAPTPAPPSVPLTPVVIDFSHYVSEKTWWGELTNPGEQSQFYSVHFNDNLSLVWNQASGEYFGTWKLVGNHLVMNFTSLNVMVRADISNDSTLTNITCSNTSTINSGKILSIVSKSLTGTVWTGNYFDEFDGKKPREFRITFKDAVNAEIMIGGIPDYYQYIVTSSGVTFRTNVKPGNPHLFFGLNNQDGKWVGTDLNPGNTWTVTKQ